MANKYRGQTEITINGEKKVLQYDINALAELEDKFDCNIEELGNLLQEDMSVKKIRTLVWAGLIHLYLDENGNWKDGKELTEKQVGLWIGTRETPIKPVIKKILDAIHISLGADLEDENEDIPKNVLAKSQGGNQKKAAGK